MRMLCVSLRPSNGGYQSQGVSRPLARILSREVGHGLATSGVSMRLRNARPSALLDGHVLRHAGLRWRRYGKREVNDVAHRAEAENAGCFDNLGVNRLRYVQGK